MQGLLGCAVVCPLGNEPPLTWVAELGLECILEAFGLLLPKFLHLNDDRWP